MPAKKPTTPEEDLAFMRSLVESGAPKASYTAGVVYLSSGLLYGGQCLFHIGQATGVIVWPGWASLTVVIGVLLGVIGCIVWAVMRDRRMGVSTNLTSTRGMNSVFNATGLANLAFLVMFGVNAMRMENFAIWLFYPAVVFAVQGAAWYVAWQMKRHNWMLMTAIGGLATSVALGLLIENGLAYLCVCTAALFGLFALPGWIMVRNAHAWSVRSAGQA